MIAIACDPGINGAIAMVCSRRGFLKVRNLPTVEMDTGKGSRIQRKADARGLREVLRQWAMQYDLASEDVVGVVERMQAYTRPGSSGSSAVTLLSMGHTAGIVEAVISGFAKTILQPTPMQWKRKLGLTSDKATSQAELRRRFPAVGRVRHDMAEAILLGCWAIGEIDGGTTPGVAVTVREWVPA